jgi:hypothetical protein
MNNLEKVEIAQRYANDRCMVFQFRRRVASCWKSNGGWMTVFVGDRVATLHETFGDAMDYLAEASTFR